MWQHVSKNSDQLIVAILSVQPITQEIAAMVKGSRHANGGCSWSLKSTDSSVQPNKI